MVVELGFEGVVCLMACACPQTSSPCDTIFSLYHVFFYTDKENLHDYIKMTQLL